MNDESKIKEEEGVKPGNTDSTQGESQGKRRKPKRNKRTPRQDPFWYAEDERAIRDLASFPFLEVVGDKIAVYDRIPGIVVARYAPVIGSEDNTDGNALNVSANYKTRAANAFFEVLTQGYTAGVSFEAPDLLMATVAGEQVLALLCEGKRAYGVCTYYLQENKYYAKDIVEALGFNYDALISELADFRAEFNIRVNQVKKTIAVPKGFTIGDRWEFINSFVFTDTKSPSYSTAYTWVPTAYMQYDAKTLTTGTSLKYISRSSNLTPAAYFKMIDDLMAALNDSDVREMFGAVRRVYKPDQLKVATELEESFLTTIVQHDVVAMQFHNMRANVLDTYAQTSVQGFASKYLPGDIYTATSVAAYQDSTGNIHCEFGIVGTPSNSKPPIEQNGALLDMYDHLVNPGNVLDATANMQITSVNQFNDGATQTARPIIARTEVVLELATYLDDAYVHLPVDIKATSGSYTAAQMKALAFMSHMDAHPLILVYNTSAIDGSLTVNEYLGEIDKYTFISQKALQKLHGRTMYKLLSMPDNSKSVT